MTPNDVAEIFVSWIFACRSSDLPYRAMFGVPVQIDLRKPNAPRATEQRYRKLIKRQFQLVRQTRQPVLSFAQDLRTANVSDWHQYSFFDNAKGKLLHRMHAWQAALSRDGRLLAWATEHESKIGVTTFSPRGWGKLVPNMSTVLAGDDGHGRTEVKNLTWLGERGFAWQEDRMNGSYADWSPVIAEVLPGTEKAPQ